MPLYFHPVTFVFYLFSTHGAAFVQIGTAGLECTARGSLQMQDIKRHHIFFAQSLNFVGLCRRTWDTCRRPRKMDFLGSDTSSPCPYGMVNFGLLLHLGHASKFQPISCLASAKLCGVAQMALLIFGRAAIILGIGPRFVNSISYLHSLDVADDVTSR